MAKLVDKTVKGTLVGCDSNAFAIMGYFRQQARKSGWTKKETDLVLNDAMAGDYNYLVATIASYFED